MNPLLLQNTWNPYKDAQLLTTPRPILIKRPTGQPPAAPVPTMAMLSKASHQPRGPEEHPRGRRVCPGAHLGPLGRQSPVGSTSWEMPPRLLGLELSREQRWANFLQDKFHFERQQWKTNSYSRLLVAGWCLEPKLWAVALFLLDQVSRYLVHFQWARIFAQFLEKFCFTSGKSRLECLKLWHYSCITVFIHSLYKSIRYYWNSRL